MKNSNTKSNNQLGDLNMSNEEYQNVKQIGDKIVGTFHDVFINIYDKILTSEEAEELLDNAFRKGILKNKDLYLNDREYFISKASIKLAEESPFLTIKEIIYTVTKEKEIDNSPENLENLYLEFYKNFLEEFYDMKEADKMILRCTPKQNSEFYAMHDKVFDLFVSFRERLSDAELKVFDEDDEKVTLKVSF